MKLNFSFVVGFIFYASAIFSLVTMNDSYGSGTRLFAITFIIGSLFMLFGRMKNKQDKEHEKDKLC